MMNLDVALQKAIELMTEFGIPIRDTYDPNLNFDDFFTNNEYDGKRLLSLIFDDVVSFPQTGGKLYHIDGKKSAAYDSFTITLPERFRENGRDDALIHECVHFLQHTTRDEDAAYIKYVPPSVESYIPYVSQRVELEAHLVQVVYIIRERKEYFLETISEDNQRIILEIFDQYSATKDKNHLMRLLLKAKSSTLI